MSAEQTVKELLNKYGFNLKKKKYYTSHISQLSEIILTNPQESFGQYVKITLKMLVVFDNIDCIIRFSPNEKFNDFEFTLETNREKLLQNIDLHDFAKQVCLYLDGIYTDKLIFN